MTLHLDHKLNFVIAIDGPAASGKSTLARLVADHYGFHHLNTGLLFRAVASKSLLSAQAYSLDDLLSFAGELDLSQLPPGELLASDAISARAAEIAVFPPLREILNEKQRRFAASYKGSVLEGRDIGTVIFPAAPAKIFLKSDVEARAKRRYAELQENSADNDYQEILANMTLRDYKDRVRPVSPLIAADSAFVINVTKLNIEQVLRTALEFVSMQMAIHGFVPDSD